MHEKLYGFYTQDLAAMVEINSGFLQQFPLNEKTAYFAGLAFASF